MSASLSGPWIAPGGPSRHSPRRATRRKIRSCRPRSSRPPRRSSTRARRLAEAEKQRLKAEAAAKEPPTTAYTPRSLVFHRAKTTFRDAPSNKPYATVSTGRRLALARWIVDRRNPLTARVAVNHVWVRHFGEPLVASTFDFGLRTPRPVHHELLDWLAVEFMESGWSMKHLHRLIVTTQAYRMQSAGGPDDAERPDRPRQPLRSGG